MSTIINEMMYKTYSSLLSETLKNFDREVRLPMTSDCLSTEMFILVGDCRCTVQTATSIVDGIMQNYAELEEAYFLDEYGTYYFEGVNEVLQIFTHLKELVRPTAMSNVYNMLHRVRSGLMRLNFFVRRYEQYSIGKAESAFLIYEDGDSMFLMKSSAHRSADNANGSNNSVIDGLNSHFSDDSDDNV